MGCSVIQQAGRIENSPYSRKGRALLDRELYLQVWTEDRERRREAGVPEEVAFRTKPTGATDA